MVQKQQCEAQMVFGLVEEVASPASQHFPPRTGSQGRIVIGQKRVVEKQLFKCLEEIWLIMPLYRPELQQGEMDLHRKLFAHIEQLWKRIFSGRVK